LVGDRPVADRDDADCLIGVGELVDDAVRAHAQGAESLETTTQCVSGEWLAFEQPERVLDGVDQEPAEFEQLASGAARENDTGHVLVGGAALGELAAQLRERDGFLSRELGEPSFDRGERLGVREDFCGLLERVVLVDGDERGGWPAVACNEYVVAAIGDIAEKLAEVASQLTHRNCLRHP
jgi:hypothetical protein